MKWFVMVRRLWGSVALVGLVGLALPSGAAEPSSAAASAAPHARLGSASAPASAHAHGSAGAHKTQRLTGLQERANHDPHQPRDRCRFESEIATLPPKGQVALTFDDGPEPGQTEQIIEVLLRHQVPATFFLVASKALLHPELVQQIVAQPSLRIANHSWSHPNFHELSVPQQLREIDLAHATLSGSGPISYFRYPYGNSSCGADAHLHALGYRAVGWHVDSCDWAFDGDGSVNDREALLCGVARPFRADFVGHVASAVRARQGGIVLLHDIHPDTVKHLEALIVQLKKDGFSFHDLAEPAFAAVLR